LSRDRKSTRLKIAYLVPYNPGIGSGVWKKIVDQTNAWSGLGCEVAVYCLSREATAGELFDSSANINVYNGALSRLSALRTSIRLILDWRPDLVYLRYSLYFPPLSTLARHVPIILEMNSDDSTEYRWRGRRQHIYNRATRSLLLTKAKGIVFISHELATRRSFRRYAAKKMVIGNGIDLNRFTSLSAPDNPSPRILFMAHTAEPWHGTDKLLHMARSFADWSFDLVGTTDTGSSQGINNVTNHGLLDSAEYEEIMAGADVAIGSLALHRAGLVDGSPLKVREYLAYGIPTIIGYRDVDFPQPRDFLLELPNEADNVAANLDLIKAFVTRMRGVRVPRNEIQHLDTSHKERQRLDFFTTVLAG
jgi:glycosyltransferase involved in cell wall biosynthesis